MTRNGREADVLVVGGGVIGLSCALACRMRGLTVTLLEKGVTGGQASGAAAGLLAPCSENGEQPDAFFQLCQTSFAMFGEWLAGLREWTGRDVELERSGSLHVVFHEADEWPMMVRARWQQEAGVRAEWLDAASVHRLEPALSREVAGALYYPDEAHLQAPAYVEALKEACVRSGVVIEEGVRGLRLMEWREAIVLAADGGGSADGGMLWTGGKLLLCTGAWSADWQEALGLRFPVHPIRGQICSFPVPFGDVRHIVFSPQGYMVGKRNGTLVCGASEDVVGFDASVTEAGIGRLVRMSRELVPALKEREPVHAWAGLRPATRDGWPLIGPASARVFCAFGHYRNGVLLSPVTARWAADWAAGCGYGNGSVSSSGEGSVSGIGSDSGGGFGSGIGSDSGGGSGNGSGSSSGNGFRDNAGATGPGELAEAARAFDPRRFT